MVSRRLNLLSATALLIAAMSCLSYGCKSKESQPTKEVKQAVKQLPALVSQGITLRWLEKQPKGQAKRLIDLKAQSGEISKGSQSGILHIATGTLYRENKPAADFKSDRVDASQDKRIVIGRGNVTIWSIDPRGAEMKSDKVTYYIDKDLVVAEGNVTFQYTLQGEKTPLAYGGPVSRMTVNTELKKFHIP